MYPRERERKKKKVNKVIRPEDVKSTADKLRYAEQEGKKISQLQGAEKEQAYKKAYDNLSIKPSQVEFEQAYNEVFDEYIKPRAKRDYIPGQATQPTLKNQKVNDIFSGGKYVLDNLGTGFESGMHNIYGAVGKTLAKPGTLIDSILDIPQTMQDNALKNVTQLQQEKMGSDFNDFYNKQVASGNTKIKDAVEEINNPGIRKETINPFEQYDIYNDVKEGIDNHALSETLNENADYHLNKAIEKQANLYGRYDQDTINKPTEFLGSVAQGVGGMIPSLATGAVTGNPSAALGVMGVGAYGGGVGQALSEGAELEDAFMYGIANAVTEVATERIVGGLPLLGSGISDDLINQVVGKLSNNPTTKNILEKVADVLGEGFEEYLSEVIGEFTTDIYSNEKTNQDIFDRFGNVQSDALMAGLVGMGTAGVLNAPGYISNFQGKSDVEIDNELNSMSNEDLADLEQQLSNETNINEQIPTELETSVQEPLNAQLEDIENINNEEKILRLTQEQYDNLPVEPSELEADGTRIVITDKMLKSDDANIALNAQRVNKENIELQSKGLWDEKVINTMAKLSNKSGIPYEITELNSNINGMYYDGKIFINKKSDNPLLTAYLHELTHGIEGTKSYDGVVQAIKNHINYSGVVEDVDFLIEQDIYQTIEDRKAYGQNLTYEQAESEVIAEYMQQFASDENFINEISNDKNLIQRIIAWLKETVSNLTGTKEQKAYNELIKKYEQAIKEVKQGNVNRSSNIQFKIFGNNSGYYGYSMSNRAVEAYEDGRKPLSQFDSNDLSSVNEVLLEDNMIPLKSVAALKRLISERGNTGEWHHTSMYGNKTSFYDISEALDGITNEMIEMYNQPIKVDKKPNKKYRGDIHYLEWGGTRARPKAINKSLTDVNIEERGSFYIITDDNGNELLRKKINSNGTEVTNYKAKEKVIKNENTFSDSQYLAFKENNKNYETSLSGTIYPYGKKPTPTQYENLSDFYKVGDEIYKPNIKGGYDTQSWDGEKFIPYNEFVQEQQTIIENDIKRQELKEIERQQKETQQAKERQERELKYSDERYLIFKENNNEYETSVVGNIYPKGKKPTAAQFKNLSEFYKVGDERYTPNGKGGYNTEVWNGKEYVTYADFDGDNTKFSLKNKELNADIKQGKKDINSPKNISLGVKVPGFTNIIKNESKNLMGYQGSELESKLTDVVKEIVDIGSISNESRQMILNAVKEKSGTVTDTFKNDLTNYLKENNISGIKIDSNLNDYFKRMKMQGISTINKELPFGIYFTTNKNGKSINDVYNALMKQYPNEFSKISEKVLPEYDMFNNIKNYLTKKQDVAFNKDNNIELSEDEINDKITQFEASVKAKIKNREKITRAFHNDENIVIKTKDKVAQKLGLQDDIETKYTKDMEVYVKEYGRIKQGENAARTIYVPKATEQGTVKQHYRTILESPQATKETIEALQGEIINGKATYKPISNEELISNTRDKANRLGETTLYDDFMKSEKISSQGIADGEYLLNKALRTNNVEQTLSLSEKLASMLNETGRALQAARILKRLTPEGQITILQRDVIKLNEQIKNKPGGKLNENMAKLTGTDLDKLNKLAKNEIVLDPKLVEKFMSAETETERADIMNELQTNIAKQIPSTLSDKVNQWRYLAMLGNPRTHIRNIVGNMVFQPVVGMKNVIATGLEKVAANTKAFKDMEKTKSILTPKDNELVKWANEDFKKFKISFSKTEKYGINRDIQGKRDIFTSKYLGTTLNKLSNWNSNLLDFEDELFTKYRYAQSLAEQMKANKVTPETVSEDMLIKMQDRAYQEALESVYRDANSLANALNKLRHTNKYTKYAVDAVMPFTKTPMNIVKRSVEYSPIGLVKEITKGTYDVMDGKITPDEYINGLSKGLTGSALAALGFFMASIGSLRTDDEDKDRLNAYERDLGEQDYSLILPNGDSYTLDWLSPSIAPMGIGVELFNLAKEKTNNKDLVGSLLDSATTVFNPIMETSMLSGLSSSLKSYDDNNLAGVVKNAVFSYVGQFFPTLGGQVARILDDKRRNTYSDTVLGRQVNVIKNKIPGLASTNEPYINKKGEYEYTGNLLERIVGNMLSPGYYKKNTKDSYDEELIRLFKLNEYENSSVLPTTYSSFTNDKVKYKFDSKDYTITNKRYAETLRTETKKFIDSSVYQGLSDDERVEVISKIQAYSQQKAKGVFFSDMDMVQKNVKFADYFKKNGSNIYSYYLNSNIKSLVDDTGKTIKNSKATQARANLEKLGIYDNIVSDYEKGNLSVDDLGYFGLNKTVLGYDEYEFNHKYNDIVSNGYESKEKSDQDIYEEIFN